MDAGRSMKSSHLRPDRTFNHHKFREKPQTGFPPRREGHGRDMRRSEDPSRLSRVNFQVLKSKSWAPLYVESLFHVAAFFF